MTDIDTIVVGAGIAGLSAADALRHAGQRVLVLEASNRPGGRIQRVERKGDMAEAGAQLIHSNYDQMHGLIDRFGLRQNLREIGGSHLAFNSEGKATSIRSKLDQFRLLGPRASLEAAWFYLRYHLLAKKFSQFDLVEAIARYDDVSTAEEFSHFSQKFRDHVTESLCYAQANSRSDTVSLYYTLNAFRLKETTTVHGLIGGNASLPERMAATLDVRYESPVARLLTTGAGVVEGVELADSTALRARHVILACTAGVAGRILPEDFGETKRFLTDFTHTPMPLVYFFLDRPLPHEAASFMQEAAPGVSYRMALDHSKFGAHMVPSGKAIISAWPSHPDNDRLIAQSDVEIIAKAQADLEIFFPDFINWIEEVRVVRHVWGVARFEPGMHRKIVEFKDRARWYRGLSFAGTDYNTIHMESGILSGMQAARRALEAK